METLIYSLIFFIWYGESVSTIIFTVIVNIFYFKIVYYMYCRLDVIYCSIQFNCCHCVLYRTFITPTYLPEDIQLLLWAPVGNKMVRQNLHIWLLRKYRLFLVLHWCYVKYTVSNTFLFVRHMCGIITFTSSKILLLSLNKRLRMENLIRSLMEYQTGVMKVSYPSIHQFIHVNT